MKQLNQLLTSKFNRRNLPDDWCDILHDSMKPSGQYKKQWKLQLLKGIRLIEENNNQSYIAYCKQDQIITEAPGSRPTKSVVNRFNTVEVEYLDENNITQYAPAQLFSILRFFNPTKHNKEQIMLVVCWLQKDRLTPQNKRLYLADNLYSYAFDNGNLWLDVIDPSQVSNVKL
jgi:hypothetical protein